MPDEIGGVTFSINEDDVYPPEPIPLEKYSEDEILQKATKLFGKTTAGLAKGIERAFADFGKPNGVITGEEFSGSFFVGLRYGKGMLDRQRHLKATQSFHEK